MSYRSKVFKDVELLGGKVIDERSKGYNQTIEVEAPDGFKWVDGGCQVLCGHWFAFNAKGSKGEAWGDLFERIGYGLEPLTKEDL